MTVLLLHENCILEGMRGIRGKHFILALFNSLQLPCHIIACMLKADHYLNVTAHIYTIHTYAQLPPYHEKNSVIGVH